MFYGKHRIFFNGIRGPRLLCIQDVEIFFLEREGPFYAYAFSAIISRLFPSKFRPIASQKLFEDRACSYLRGEPRAKFNIILVDDPCSEIHLKMVSSKANNSTNGAKGFSTRGDKCFGL